MGENRVNFFRANLVFGAILIPAIWFVRVLFPLNTADPLIHRLAFSFIALLIIGLSYFSDFVRRNIRKFFIVFLYTIIVWFSYIIYINNALPEFVVSQLIWIVIFSSYFENWKEFGVFSVFTILISAATVFMLPDPLVNKLLYIIILPSGLMVNSVNPIWRLRLEKELGVKTSELDKFKLIVQNAGEHMIVTDIDGKIIYANHAAEILTGFTLPEMLGKRPSLWGKQMTKEFYSNMWDTIKNKKQRFIGEITNRRKNGELYTAHADITPAMDGSGNIQFFVGIERDITLEKRAKEALENRAAELSRMNELMVDRELKMIEMKKELARLKG